MAANNTLKKTANKILKKHEDNNEYHFHELDREWIIAAMEEYAAFCQSFNKESDLFERPKSMEISAKSDSEDVRIYIDGILHIRFPRDKNTKIQSWIEGHSKRYVIKIRTKKHQDYIEYDNKQMWERVLKLLNEHL